MKIRLLSIALIAVLLASCSSTKQGGTGNTGVSPIDPDVETSVIYLGPLGGFNSSQHTADLPSFADQNAPCPHFKTSNSTGFFGGVFLEIPFAKVNSRHVIQLRLVYSTLPADFTETGDKYPSLVEDPSIKGGYGVINSITQHSLKVDYNMFSAEILYRFNAWNNLALAVGPSFDFPIKKTLVQKYTLLEPDNVQFKQPDGWEKQGLKYENNNRTIIVPTRLDADGNIKDAAGFRMGLKIGLQYEIITKTGVDFIPGIFYNLGVTKLTSNVDWRAHAIQLGCDVRFSLKNPF